MRRARGVGRFRQVDPHHPRQRPAVGGGGGLVVEVGDEIGGEETGVAAELAEAEDDSEDFGVVGQGGSRLDEVVDAPGAGCEEGVIESAVARRQDGAAWRFYTSGRRKRPCS